VSMSNPDIVRLLEAALPEASIDVQGDGYKYQVNVISGTFAGMNRVKRQQAVYRILNEHIQSGAIHAVNMQLLTPDEAAALRG
jgi:acid stress-induced BolA-like protein IbaG/YrbA